MQRFYIIISSILCLAFITFLIRPSFEVHATPEEEQQIENLRQQIAELEKQAAQYRTNVAGERAKADSLKKEISIIQNQIGGIETQIALTGKKIDKTKIEIEDVEGNIVDTQSQIGKRKETIGQLLVFLNRQDDEPLITSLIKNRNMSDFFRQGQYLANINTQLLDLVDELGDAKKSLEDNRTDLQGKQQELEDLKQENQEKKASLASVKTSKDTILTKTKGQEAQYQKMLTDIEARKADFFKQLRFLETKVVQGGLYIVHITAASVPPRGTKLYQNPEDDTRITQGYGMTAYAKRGAYGGAPHNGIDFSAGFGSPIKTIGDGEIVANGFNDGWGNWVAVKHTNSMVSIYGHMSSLSLLKVGSVVKMGDVIGYEGATGNATGSHVHLSLYRDFFTYVNDKKNQLYFNYFDGSVNPLDYL